MQALHQENVSFCSLRQINKWNAVYIGLLHFGLTVSGGVGGGGRGVGLVVDP